MTVNRTLGFAAILSMMMLVPFAGARAVPANSPEVPKQAWTFSGLFGKFDRAQLRRGYKIYKDSCANCHSMNLLSYRNLVQPGGPEMSEAKVKELAAEIEVSDGFDDDGEPVKRPGKLFDRFPAPYGNDNEARASNNGALPPDLSVITKARGILRTNPWYLDPVMWIKDIFSNYQESGADYIHALMTGYKDEAPKGVTMNEGMSYNPYFPGAQIAMPAPLADDQIDYEDGTKPTLENYAKDVTAFLQWAAEPHMEKRKRTGFSVMIYLFILTLLLGLVKRAIWSRTKH